jgi:hypothetical protein
MPDTFDMCLERARKLALQNKMDYLVYKHPVNGQWTCTRIKDAFKEGIPITHWRMKVLASGEQQLV